MTEVKDPAPDEEFLVTVEIRFGHLADAMHAYGTLAEFVNGLVVDRELGPFTGCRVEIDTVQLGGNSYMPLADVIASKVADLLQQKGAAPDA